MVQTVLECMYAYVSVKDLHFARDALQLCEDISNNKRLQYRNPSGRLL